MGARPNIALRPLSQAEVQTWHRVAKARSERVDTVRRAKAWRTLAAGAGFTQAGRRSGRAREGVSQRVDRFNQRGLASLVIASGRGRKPTDAAEARTPVVQRVQRHPDRVQEQPATWSLNLVQRAFRRGGWPSSGATTSGRMLPEEGFSRHRDRPWCQRGTASRLRKDGSSRVRDPQAQEKKRERVGLRQRGGVRARAVVQGAKPARLPPDLNRESGGRERPIPNDTRINRCARAAHNG